MTRYASTFGMLGFVGVLVLQFGTEAEVGDVIVRAVFWAVVCSIFGGLIGWGVQHIVNDLELPSVDEELRWQRQEAWLVERHDLAVDSGGKRRSEKSRPEGRTSEGKPTDNKSMPQAAAAAGE